MLVLSRRPGERLIIDESIVVTVTQIGPGRVRLGIEAPPGVRVIREELQTRDFSAQARSAGIGAGD